jgi:hypothetical protein
MGQYMEKEPSYKLIGLDSHGLLFITIGIVPPWDLKNSFKIDN